MSPLRPGIGAANPTAPAPVAARALHCPACGHGFSASAQAISLRCPRCTGPIRLDDHTLERGGSTRIDTMGHVQLTSTSIVSGEVVCGRLTNRGRFAGQMLVHGPIELATSSHTSGQLKGQSLRVDPGATLRARVVIQPLTAVRVGAPRSQTRGH